MISWIRGELIQSWLKNQKFFVLINCQGIGYEIQTSFLLEKDHKSETTLWLHHIKREDSEAFYGFRNKNERDFFRDLLNVKGIGPQIGMALFNKYSLNEVINALMTNDQRLINSVPGIGQKMTERIFLELKNKIKFKECNLKQTNKSTEIKNNEIAILVQDIKIALDSLDFPKKDIQKTIDFLQIDLENDIKKLKSEDKINFEYLFKKSLNFLENN